MITTVRAGGAAMFLAILAASVSAEEVALVTPTGTLFGTLVVPPNATRVALIIAGSGPTDRDGNGINLLTDSYKLLAEALEAKGIASLRYDKRGVAASVAAGPREIDLRFEMYVDDAVAWGEQLLSDGRFTSLTVIGHSEGALIATLVAQRLGVRSLITVAGAGRPVDEVILEQLASLVSPALLQRSREIISALKMGNTVSSVPVELQVLFRPSVQPYLISLFRYVPAEEIARVTVPTLIIQGTSDIQVSIVDASLLAAAKSDGNLVLIEGMNHVLKQVGNDVDAQNRSYFDPSFPLDATLARVAAQFVVPVARRRAVR